MDCFNNDNSTVLRYKRQRVNYTLDVPRFEALNPNLTQGRNFTDIFTITNFNNTFVIKNDTVI